MMNLMQELVKLVPPPEVPVAATGDWDHIEAQLRLAFPPDYKEFIQTYGAGTLCELFEIVSPFQLIDPPRAFWANWARFYTAMVEQGETIPYPYYPLAPGLLPCGTYGTVNILNWYTCGPPSEWQILYYDRDHGFFPTGGGLVSLLVSLLKGQPPLPNNVMNPRDLPQPFRFRKN
jgi:hypothetical protein